MKIAETFGLQTTRIAYGAVRIFSRDGGQSIRIEADSERERGANERLAALWWFASEAVARDVAMQAHDLLLAARFKAVDGWVSFPADKIRTVVRTAMTHLNVETVTRMPEAPAPRTTWTHRRCAWLGYLIGQGWAAKRIAEDPLIRSTPNNVYRQAHRMDLTFTGPPAAAALLRLPVATSAFYERLAARHGLTRDAMIRRIVIAAASDPSLVETLVAAD